MCFLFRREPKSTFNRFKSYLNIKVFFNPNGNKITFSPQTQISNPIGGNPQQIAEGKGKTLLYHIFGSTSLTNISRSVRFNFPILIAVYFTQIDNF